MKFAIFIVCAILATTSVVLALGKAHAHADAQVKCARHGGMLMTVYDDQYAFQVCAKSIEIIYEL